MPQIWLQSAGLPRLQRRHAPAHSHQPGRLFCPVAGQPGVSLSGARSAGSLAFDPFAFLHGALWQPFTYSFVHLGILGTLFELLSLWFLAGFLEGFHNANWVTSLYAVSVLGTAAAALALYVVASTLAPSLLANAIPALRLFWRHLRAAGGHRAPLRRHAVPAVSFPIGIKARYLVVIYALVAVAMLFGQERMYAFAQLGGALAGLAFVRLAPRRGISFTLSESWYGLRNRYYRWKRRRAARKFEVYMRRRAAPSSSTARAA